MSESDKREEFWGQLIGSDDVPSDRFRQLLTSIATFIRESVEPVDDASLSPAKLAAFYGRCGHDFDALFLHPSSSSALSSIYQTIQCFHSLQPTLDPAAAPSIPTLTTEGFIRWETVQLLLEPQTHVPILQRAVQQFELFLPDSRQRFPDILPSACLPSQPSPELTKWHDRQLEDWTVSKRQKEKEKVPNFDDDSTDRSRRRKDVRSTHEDVSDRSPDIKGGWRYIASPPRSREHMRSRRSPLNFGSAGPSPNRHRASDERRFYPDPFPDRPTPKSTKQSPGFASEQHSNGGRSRLSHAADSSRRTPPHSLTPNSAESNSRFSRRHSSAQLYGNPYLEPHSAEKDSVPGSVGDDPSKARSLSRRPKSPYTTPEINPTQRKRSTSRSSRPPPLHTNSRTRSVSHSSTLNYNGVEQSGFQPFTQDTIAQDFANPYRSSETIRSQLGNLPKSKSGRGRRVMVESEEVG